MGREIERKIIKGRAKENLKSNLGICIVALAIFPIIISVMSTGSDIIYDLTGHEVNPILTLIATLISFPLTVGFSKFALNICRNGSAKISDVDDGLRVFFKAMGVGILVTLAVLVGTILFIVPGIIVGYMMYYALYILADDPSKSVMDCIKESIELTKGYKMQLFILDLSFILWYLLGGITLGLALLWVYPYVTLTQTEFYLEIKKDKEAEFIN